MASVSFETTSSPFATPQEEEILRLQARVAECETLVQTMKDERRQLLACVAPFAEAYEKGQKKLAEYDEMETALRGRIATLENILDGDDTHMKDEFLECEQCDAPLVKGSQCYRCVGDETVCVGCCRYPTVHGL